MSIAQVKLVGTIMFDSRPQTRVEAFNKLYIFNPMFDSFSNLNISQVFNIKGLEISLRYELDSNVVGLRSSQIDKIER